MQEDFSGGDSYDELFKSGQKLGEKHSNIFSSSGQVSSFTMQFNHLNSVLQMKSQQVQRLEAEIKTLLRIQVEAASKIRKAIEDSADYQKQLAEKNKSFKNRESNSFDDRAQTPGNNIARSRASDIAALNDKSVFLRCFVYDDQATMDRIVQNFLSINDSHQRGELFQTFFKQMQQFVDLFHFFETMASQTNIALLVPMFESKLKQLINCKKVILWAYVPSGRVFVSQTASLLIPQGEGLLTKVFNEKSHVFLDKPKIDNSYSKEYDDIGLVGCHNVVYHPVMDSENNLIWVIQINNIMDNKGKLNSPSQEDMIVLYYLSKSLQRIYQGENKVDELIKKILIDSSSSLLSERQVMPLLDMVQLTVSRIIGCEQIQIFFVDKANNQMFQLTEAKSSGNDESLNFGSFSRVDFSVENAGIAGYSFKNKKPISVRVAKEHPGFNATFDGEYPNGSILSIPLINQKGQITLVSIARQKRNGIMFTSNDEVILESLSRVASSALRNSQLHEQNISEIKKAISSQKYYTALLAIAQELSSVLDTDTLIRKIMTKAQTFISADRCSLFIVDPIRGDLWSIVAHGATNKIHIGIGEGIAGNVAATGKTINIPNAYLDPRFNSSIDKATGYVTKSILCVAIKNSKGEIIGCTQMINKIGGQYFTQMDEELMAAFNVFCGIALSNAQLYESAKQTQKRMSTMLDITLSLSSSTNANAVISNFLDSVKELIGAKQCFLFVIDREHNICKSVSVSNENSIVFSVKHDPVGYVASTGVEINVTDPRKDKRFDLFFFDQMKIEPESLLLIPVVDGKGQVIGVFEALDKIGYPKFSEDDALLLGSFSSFIGLALEQWFSKKSIDFLKSEVDLLDTLSNADLALYCLPDKLRVLEPLASTVTSPAFDVELFPKNEQFRILIFFFEDLGLLNEYKIQLGTILRLLKAISSSYPNIPFHSWNNAIEVTQFIYTQIKTGRLNGSFTKLEIMALLFSSICHDMAHTQKCLTMIHKSKIPLSNVFRDQPLLETFHCQAAILAVSKPNCNILSNLSIKQLNDYWIIVKEIIMSTDKSLHSKIIDDVKLRMQGEPIDLSNTQNRLSIMKLLLKAANACRAAKPFEVSHSWGDKVFSEAREKLSKSNPTQSRQILDSMSDLDNNGRAAYCNNYAEPIFETLCAAIPVLKPIETQYRENMKMWKQLFE